jgi:MSHA biogenesis protein MshQ
VGTAAIATDGTRGQVLSLANTEDSYVEIADHALLDLSDSVTVAAWVNAFNGGPDIAISKGGWTDSYTVRIDDVAIDGPVQKINFHGRNGTGISSSGAIPINQWVHIAITFDLNAAGNDTAFYINGVLDSTKESGQALSVNNAPVRIGYSETAAWTRWNGLIDDVQIYDTALHLTQVQTVMNGGVIPEPSTFALVALGSLVILQRLRCGVKP